MADFDTELYRILRSNTRFRSAVFDLLYDVFETMDDTNFNKTQFLSKFSKKERTDRRSAVDIIRKTMKTRIQQLLKKTLDEVKTVNEGIIEKDPVKSVDMEMPLRTAGELQDGGFREHYKSNTSTDPETSNRADELMKAGFEHFKPMHRCPKCKGINLYQSLLAEYVECEDCDSLILRENLVIEE